MTTIRISSIASRECIRRTLRRHRIAELAILALSTVLTGAAVWAIRDEHAGDPWPLAAVAVIAAGVGSTMLGAVLLAAIASTTGAVGARVGAVDARTRESAQDLRALRGEVEGLTSGQRAMIAEMARMRMANRDLVVIVTKALQDARWQGYAACLADQQAGRVSVLRPE